MSDASDPRGLELAAAKLDTDFVTYYISRSR